MPTDNTIDPEKVIFDREAIDPGKVIIDREALQYDMTKTDRKRVAGAFAGEPLAFIANTDERAYAQSVTETLPDCDDYRKRMALAAYFTSNNRGADYRFVLANLDGVIEQFYKKKTSVDAAYNDIAKLYNPGEGSAFREFPGAVWDGVKNAAQTTAETGYSFAAGGVEAAAKISSGYLKYAKWGLDLQAAILSPLMSEEQKEFAKGYNNLIESAGRDYVLPENKKISDALDRKANANPDFLLNMITGDFDKVSTGDFVKALARSAPDMAFQLLVGGVTPWAVPAYIGASEVAQKDYQVQTDHPEWSGGKKWSYIGISAANEALLDIATAKIMGGNMSREAGAKIVRDGLLKYLGKSTLKEGATEGAQQLNSNILDYLYQANGDTVEWSSEQKLKAIFTGVLESAFIGGVWGSPYGALGFRNAREFAGFTEQVRAKHEAKIQELENKEELSPDDASRLEFSKLVLDSASTQTMIAADYIADTIEKISDDESIRSSDDFKAVMSTATSDMDEETVINGAKKLRNYNLRHMVEWNFEDVNNRVVEFSKHIRNTRFNVLEQWDDAPEAVKKQAENQDLNSPRGFIYKDEVYIDASRVSPSEVLEVLLHEVVGHKGLKAVIPEKNLAGFLDGVYREHFNDEAFKDIAKQYNLGNYVTTVDQETGETRSDYSIDNVANQRIAAEEYVANLAQKGQKPAWWKEFIQQIRMGLAKLPLFKDVRMTDKQIETLLARSARKMTRGRTEETLGINKSLVENNNTRFSLSEAVKQKFGSGNTSLKQVAAGFKKIDFVPGTVNLDLGGGKFDEGTKYLSEKGVNNLVFDPVNRDSAHNRKIFDAVKNGGTDTVTCNNVLNVIGEAAARDNVILQAAKALKPSGTAYFTVYEGDGTGQGRQSQSDAWQEHRKTADYMEEIQKHFADVSVKNKVIAARSPQTDGKFSAWAMDETFENPARFSLAEYSEEDQRDIVAVLRPFVGNFVKKDDVEYQKYLADKGIDIPVRDAWKFAVEASHENMAAARKHSREQRDKWIYENVPLYANAVDFAGDNFKIIPSSRFKGEEFTGTFIAKKKESGVNSEELAAAIAREQGRDSIDVEQELIDFFRDLKKTDLYKMYSDWKKETITADKELDKRIQKEYEEQERFKIENDVVEILTRGEEISAEWVFANRKAYNELYKQLFAGKDAPYNPGKKDMEAINAALVQQVENAAGFAQAYKTAREKARAEFTDNLRNFKEKVMNAKADAVRMQRDALDFSEKHLPPEYRGEFARAIVALMEYSPGRRTAEFRNLLDKMTQRASDTRKKQTLTRIAKRLNQLGERADGSRKVRGLRDEKTQAVLNRIIEISRMDNTSLTMAVNTNLMAMEKCIAAGENTVDLEYDIVLLNQYGELWNKNADELNAALFDLEQLAKDGKNSLLDKIHQRAAEDEQDRNELWEAVNGGKCFSPVDKKILADKSMKRNKCLKAIDNSFWKTLSLDGIFEAIALFSNREQPHILNRFCQMAHEAKRNKDVLNMKNTDACRKELQKLCGTNSALTIAETVGKWRKIQEHSGVFRFDPDPDAKQFNYKSIPVDDARKILAEYDGGNKNIPDYEAEAIRQQLRTLDLRIKFEVPEEFNDGATDRLIKLINQKNTQNEQEPEIVIPSPTYNGAQREIPLTQTQALFLKLMWDQKDIRYKMHYNGYTAESMAQLDKFLLPEVKELGNWMRTELEKDRVKISEVYLKMYYAAFPSEELYFPSLYDVNNNRLQSSVVDLAEPGEGANPHAYSPGALKVRVYHLKDVKIADALTVFQNHRMMMNHFVTYAEAARKMRSVLMNSDVANAIKTEHGMECYNNIKDGLLDFINGGKKDVLLNDVAANVYRNAVRSKMVYNAFSGMKQTMGAITYLQEIPVTALASGVSYALAHPKEVYATLGHTDYFAVRWNAGGNADLRLLMDAAGKDSTKSAEIFGKLDNLGSLPLRFGDAASVLIGGYAVYKYHYENMVKRGMDTTQARKEALLKWEMATERTQQSSAPFMLNSYQRGGYPMRLFTTFLSNQILLWNHNAPAVYKAMHYGKTAPLKNAGKGITALVLSSMAMTALDQLKDHWSDGDYQWWDLFYNMLADGVCGVGPGGQIASEAIDAIKPDGWLPRNFIIGDIVNFGYAMKNRADDEKDISDNDWRDVVWILQGIGYAYVPAAHAGAVARETRKWWRISNPERK